MTPPLLATCPTCKRTVSMTTAGTLYAHGTPGNRCPGGGTRVGAAVIEMLEEVAQMKRRRKP